MVKREKEIEEVVPILATESQEEMAVNMKEREKRRKGESEGDSLITGDAVGGSLWNGESPKQTL